MTYDEILSSPAMASLPAEVTDAEQKLVDQVIPEVLKINIDEDE